MIQDDNKYNIKEQEFNEISEFVDSITTDEDRSIKKSSKEVIKRQNKEMEKEPEYPEGTYFPGMKWSKKRTIKFWLKVVIVIFLFFTPIGQDFMIGTGTYLFKNGADLIVDTFTNKANEYGVFDYSKPIGERIVTMWVVVMVPVILFVFLGIKFVMWIRCRLNYKNNRTMRSLDEQLEDYDWHRKMSRYETYKDIYKY